MVRVKVNPNSIYVPADQMLSGQVGIIIKTCYDSSTNTYKGTPVLKIDWGLIDLKRNNSWAAYLDQITVRLLEENESLELYNK
jgi:hypothetical protein